jgi:hypothetical protein
MVLSILAGSENFVRFAPHQDWACPVASGTLPGCPSVTASITGSIASLKAREIVEQRSRWAAGPDAFPLADPLGAKPAR